ncbi:hypothetical protein [Archaeoglobus neptunius]|uniref:hypothetical protein n=1 Tax=Archaeoglobus neptunius TaxID=2798580 RepID=UPI00192807EF|nr:hypothetical protein [Archaeoglobus neptunius]
MEYSDIVETMRGLYKMGFASGKTTLDLMKVGMDSYVNMYGIHLSHFLPSESFESVKKTMDIYLDSQAKVLDNFKKLLEQIEKQQDEIFNRLTEISKTPEKKKSS